MKQIVLCFSLLLALLSCKEEAVYESFESLEGEEWQVGHPVLFVAEIPEKGDYDISLGIRHTTDYEMANLWCFLRVADTVGNLWKDSVDIRLAEPDGRWVGDGHSLKTLEYPLTTLPMPVEAGKYTFTVVQGMRTQALKGIKDVGLVIRRRK
ncbi:MAG: gliding motility lipoprotein GldH [Culturomica sp.]|jgi:gliding motility-associated lipoprotein GldH|nr:gliding motility lipoprotein GldH [Culturomica sp.]